MAAVTEVWVCLHVSSFIVPARRCRLLLPCPLVARFSLLLYLSDGVGHPFRPPSPALVMVGHLSGPGSGFLPPPCQTVCLPLSPLENDGTSVWAWIRSLLNLPVRQSVWRLLQLEMAEHWFIPGPGFPSPLPVWWPSCHLPQPEMVECWSGSE